VLADWMASHFGAAVTWLPFDLHPEYPPEGVERSALTRRYGTGVDDHLRSLFEQNGLAFNPPAVMPNSRNALRLSELARDHGLHEDLHNRLMDATWRDGESVGDVDALRAHAAAVGLPSEEVERVLAGDDYGERVAASTAQAASLGVNGIPAFVLDHRLLVLGAQPRSVFEQAFAQLGEGVP
jgi:predicted DsbA family dithiol-disulfide isomerase